MAQRRSMAMTVVVLSLMVLGCSLSVQMVDETPEPTPTTAQRELPTVAMPTRVATQEPPTPVPPTPTPFLPTPTVPNWPVVLADDFDDPESGFVRSGDERSRLSYEDGRYTIGVVPESSIAWSSRSGSLLDFVMEVAVSADAEVGFGGVVFHKQGDSQFYTFAITPDGQHSLMTSGEAAEPILNWQDSSHIRTGAATNLLRVVRLGATVALYVNGQYLDSVEDATFTEGEVGVLAGTFEGETHALFHFDNLRVYAPASVSPPTPTATSPATSTATQVLPTLTPVRPSPTSTRAPVEFDPIIFAEGVTAEWEPIRPSMSFSYGIKQIYGVFACRGMYRGLEFVQIWYRDGQQCSSGTVIRERDDERGLQYVWLKGPGGGTLLTGHYTLELWFQGQLVQSGSFLIQ